MITVIAESNMQYPKKLADRVIWLREYHGLTQKQVAYGIGMDVSQVKSIETSANPAVKTMLRLVGFYEELNLHWLITGQGAPFFKQPEPIVIDIPKKQRKVRKSLFTTEQIELIKSSWPEIPVIEGLTPHQVRCKANSLGLRVDAKTKAERRKANRLNNSCIFGNRECKETDIAAYNEKIKRWKSEELLPSQAFSQSTFTPEQDVQIMKAWPNYKSVTMPHKTAAQIYQRGIRIGMPKLRESV